MFLPFFVYYSFLCRLSSDLFLPTLFIFIVALYNKTGHKSTLASVPISVLPLEGVLAAHVYCTVWSLLYQYCHILCYILYGYILYKYDHILYQYDHYLY